VLNHDRSSNGPNSPAAATRRDPDDLSIAIACHQADR
jgi:hypothetical protein